MRLFFVLSAVLLGACSEPVPPPPQVTGAAALGEYSRGGDWPSYNRDLAGTRYSALRQVNATNVDELRQAWSYPLGRGEPSGAELTPLVIDGVLYLTTGDLVVALNAHTGAERWRYAVAEGAARRGLAYWPGSATSAPRVLVTAGRALVALDVATGAPSVGFGVEGRVAIPALYNAAPSVYRDLVILGSHSPPGGIHAVMAGTGESVWSFGAHEQSAEVLEARAFALTIDVDRALVFGVFAGPAESPHYGGGREPERPLANAVVALDALTGAVRWQFQVVRHDIWNYDLVAPPALLDVTIAGERIPVLAQPSAAGYLYVLNRVTGEPVFGLVDTPVPSSDVPGERAAPTQPLPTKPPPLARVTYVADDFVAASDTTREHVAACRALRDEGGGVQNSGPFTPYRFRPAGGPLRSSVVFPGALGGIGWGGVAADPDAGLVFVNTTNEGGLGWLEPYDADSTAAQTGTGSRAPALYRRAATASAPELRFAVGAENGAAAAGRELWPCQKPPWGELFAVNVASGEIAWRVPLGVSARLPEGRRATGRPNVGGAIVTAAGLVFIGATDDRRFRAFDARTGQELWATELPRGGHSVPITFLGKDGRQYVAIAAAGTPLLDDGGPADAQALIAYALP